MRYKLVYKTAFGQIEFSVESGFWIEKFDSPTKQSIKLETSTTVNAIGERVENQNVVGKAMTIRGTLMGAADDKRKKLLHIIAPMIPAQLIFDDTYTMDVYPRETPDVERYANNAQFSMVLFAPYPYWRAANGNTVALLGLTREFRFPWNISDPNPFRFSTFTKNAYTNVYNAGDAPTNWKLTFTAKSALSNPKVENVQTGEFVKLFCDLAVGQSVVVDTRQQEISATMIAADGTETDAFDKLDIDSSRFLLAVGDNLLKTTCDTENALLYATLEYSTNIVGV